MQKPVAKQVFVFLKECKLKIVTKGVKGVFNLQKPIFNP